MKNPEPTLELDALLRHQDWLRTLVRVLVADDHRAEDVVQETWLAAMKHPPGPGSVRGWLYHAARNIALRVRDREARRARQERAGARPERLPTTADVVEREALRRAVVERVLELEAALRTAVLLHYFEGLPVREVARRLGISVEATRRRLRRAEAEIRRKLAVRHGADWRTALGPLLGWQAGKVAAALTGIITMTNTIKVLIAVAVVAGVFLLVRSLPRDPAVPEVSESAAGRTAEQASSLSTRDTSNSARPSSGSGKAFSLARSASGRAPVVRGTVSTRQGTPLAGATVRAYERLYPERVPILPLAGMRTDASGTFTFYEEVLGRSDIYLEATAPGTYSDRASSSPGEQVHFRLGKPGTLRGRVTQGGVPVANARFEVLRIGGRFQTKVCRTDADGRYCLDRLKPGFYFCKPGRVEVVAGKETRVDLAFEKIDLITVTGLVATTPGDVPLPDIDVTLVLKHTKVTTRTDSSGRFRFEKVPAEYQYIFSKPHRVCIGDVLYVKTGGPTKESSAAGVYYRIPYVPGVRVCGMVVGPDSMPVAGAKIRARTRFGSFHQSEETTGEAGQFELFGRLKPERYEVEFRIVVKGNTLGIFTKWLDLAPGKCTDGLVLQLPRGGVVSGRVREEQGGPAAYALVFLSPVGQGKRPGHHVRADQDGRYRMENVPVGRYVLGVRVCGRPVFKSPEVVDVLEGMRIEGRDVTLPAGAVLAGRVEDTEGRPLPEARVRARPHTKNATRSRPRWISARMESEGRFFLHGLESGDYEVHASTPDRTHRLVQDRIAPAGTQDLVFRLGLRPRIKGRVRFASSGKAATTFRLSLHRSGKMNPSRFRFLDAGGRFTLLRIEAGDYELEATVEKDGALFVGRTAFRMPADRNPPFQDFRVEPTRSLRGLVQDPDGVPLPGARVTLVLEGRTLEEPLYTTDTDQGGRYSVEQVQPGAYEVRASHPEWVEVAKRIQIASGTISPLDFVLERTGGFMRVIVVDDRNQPVQGARIHVLRSDGTFLNPDRTKYERAYFEEKRSNPDLKYEAWVESYTRTDTKGVLVRRFLPSGRYEVRAEAGGFEAGTGKVEIRAGVESKVRIEVRRSGGG